MAAGQGAVVEESLLFQYGLHLGDELALGGETFRILGTIKKLPGEINMFAGLAPRVLIARNRLPAPLMARGSLVRYMTYLKLPPSVNPPALDLANEDLVRSHLQAVWLGETGQKLGPSVQDALDREQLPGLPLTAQIAAQVDRPQVRQRAVARGVAILGTA